MFALAALILFLCAAVLAVVLTPRAWPVALPAAFVALGLAAWLWQTGAGILP